MSIIFIELDLDMALADITNNWAEYSYQIKKVRDYEIVKLYNKKLIPKYGHVRAQISDDESAQGQYDYYIDIYWKDKKIATDIRLREPDDDQWYKSNPTYTLSSNHQNGSFKADQSKFTLKASFPVTKGTTSVRRKQNTTENKDAGSTSEKRKTTNITIVQQRISIGKLADSLIERAKAAKGCSSIPQNYWILAERNNINNAGATDNFDDNIHLMYGEKEIIRVKGTSTPGIEALTTKSGGAAVLDWGWHYDIWVKGGHKKKSDGTFKCPKAFRQKASVRMLRDINKNNISGDSGAPHTESGTGINFHPASYRRHGKADKIGGWSYGCVVVQSWDDYYSIWDKVNRLWAKYPQLMYYVNLGTALDEVFMKLKALLMYLFMLFMTGCTKAAPPVDVVEARGNQPIWGNCVIEQMFWKDNTSVTDKIIRKYLKCQDTDFVELYQKVIQSNSERNNWHPYDKSEIFQTDPQFTSAFAYEECKDTDQSCTRRIYLEQIDLNELSIKQLRWDIGAPIQCESTKNETELTICNNKKLWGHEKNMRMMYFENGAFDGAGNSVSKNRSWSLIRNACKTDVICLEKLYKARFKRMDEWEEKNGKGLELP